MHIFEEASGKDRAHLEGFGADVDPRALGVEAVGHDVGCKGVGAEPVREVVLQGGVLRAVLQGKGEAGQQQLGEEAFKVPARRQVSAHGLPRSGRWGTSGCPVRALLHAGSHLPS